eukprot:1613933-Prymnesium_polylepis.1
MASPRPLGFDRTTSGPRHRPAHSPSLATTMAWSSSARYRYAIPLRRDRYARRARTVPISGM